MEKIDTDYMTKLNQQYYQNNPIKKEEIDKFRSKYINFEAPNLELKKKIILINRKISNLQGEINMIHNEIINLKIERDKIQDEIEHNKNMGHLEDTQNKI